MPDDFNERLDALETMARRLTGMLVEQREMNLRLGAFVQQQIELNQRQAEFNADVKTTLARVETLLARLPRGEENGRDA